LLGLSLLGWLSSPLPSMYSSSNTEGNCSRTEDSRLRSLYIVKMNLAHLGTDPVVRYTRWPT
jgi:hypothetical protein